MTNANRLGSVPAFVRGMPDSPGIYLMKGQGGKILYIGKAGNLRRRVSSYFLQAQEAKIERLLQRVKKIDYEKTDTAIEALILEAQRIREFAPQYNVKEKDGKSFLYVEVTKEDLPRVLLSRGKDLALSGAEGYGPFTSASSIRAALRILRRIFPWSTHSPEELARRRLHPERSRRACFDYEIGLCPGTCIGAVDQHEYAKNISNVRLFFEGKKKKIIQSLNKEMEAAGKNLEFEKAAAIRRRLFALQHVEDVALIQDETGGLRPATGDLRIEGYDISNISGTSAVGSMAVFKNGKPDKNEYRKFRIRTVMQSNDTGMLKEVLRRRFKRVHTTEGWALPQLVLIDGGKPQVNAAREIIEESGLKIPIVGIAKGPTRKKNEFIGEIPAGIRESALIKVRDEAHRFAIAYHKNLRGRRFLGAK